MDQVKNFIKATVSTIYDTIETEIVLNSGHNLPDPISNNYNLVWWNSTSYPDPADDPNVEIVRVTALLGNTITIIRNQELSGASTKNNVGVNYKMILGPTAKTITDISFDISTDISTHSDLTTGTHGAGTDIIATDADITTHAILTGTHGVTEIVGVSEVQTLTNKSIDADNNTLTNIADDEIKAAAGIVESKFAWDNTSGHRHSGTNTSKVHAESVTIDDIGSIITATEVEGALQENRAALNVEEAALVTHMADVSTHGVTEIADVSTVSTEIDTDIGTHAALSDVHHTEAHLLGFHTTDTLANLNLKVTDATLIDTGDSRLSDARTPTAHDLDSHNSCTLAELSTNISDEIIASVSGTLPIIGGVLTGGLTCVVGSTTVQPLKLISGTNLTTPVSGVFEYDGIDLFFTVV